MQHRVTGPPRAPSGLGLLVSKVTQIYGGPPPQTVITHRLQRDRDKHGENRERREREALPASAGRKGRQKGDKTRTVTDKDPQNKPRIKERNPPSFSVT